MDFEKLLQIASLVFGVGGIGSFFLSLRRAKSQNHLDVSTAWEKLSAPLLERLQTLEKKTEEQEATIQDLNNFVDDLLDWNKKLTEQIIKAGEIPHPFVRRKRITTEYPKTQE